MFIRLLSLCKFRVFFF